MRTFSTKSFLSYDTNALSFFNVLSPQPSTTQKLRYNDLFIALKDDLPNIAYLFLPATEVQQNGRIDLKNPSDTPITEVNSIDWVQFEGYNPDGATTYINLNRNLSSNLIYLQNNSFYGSYYRTCFSANTDFGTVDTSVNNNVIRFTIKGAGDARLININDNRVPSAGGVASIGFESIVRTSNNNFDIYHNGIFVASITSDSTGVPNSTIFVGGRNFLGVFDQAGTNQISCLIAGNKDVNQLRVYNAIQAYFTSIGKQV